MYYLLFLAHVFRKARETLDTHLRETYTDYGKLASTWRTFLEGEGNRETFHTSIVQSAEKHWAELAISGDREHGWVRAMCDRDQ